MAKDFDNSVYCGHRVDEYCPQCGSQLLGNPLDDRWCSRDDCDYIRFGHERETTLKLD
jgi:hypothetical protein